MLPPYLLVRLLRAACALVLFLAFLLPGTSAWTREIIDMYVGEIQVLEIGRVERVAIGNPRVASNTILPRGQIVLMGDAVGATTMHIWLEEGGTREFDVLVRDRGHLDAYQELVALLREVPGVEAVRVGDLTVVKGEVASRDAAQLSRILAQFQGVLDLVTTKNQHDELKSLLAAIPGTTILEVGAHTVISGEVSEEYSKLIGIVQEKYPDLMDLTRTRAAVAGKMIYMQVRIMEMKKSVQEKLGIRWGDFSLAGPSFQYGIESPLRGGTILNADGTSNVLKKAGVADLRKGVGYFGIATGITSIINLLESSGDTVILAEPRLSTRSGGKASFLAGGEIPMPVTSSMGQTTVEFKKYGIALDIEPVIDDHNNILAHIETEVSTPDRSVAVDGIPGLLSRKTSTDISMRAGETLVIAGLLNEAAQRNQDNVKWLGQLPVLGALFRSKDFMNERSELVILVTPRIHDASSSDNREALGAAESMRRHHSEIISGSGLLE